MRGYSYGVLTKALKGTHGLLPRYSYGVLTGPSLGTLTGYSRVLARTCSRPPASHTAFSARAASSASTHARSRQPAAAAGLAHLETGAVTGRA